MKIILILTFIFLQCLYTSVYGYPYKLTCDRSMTPGSVIMGNPVKNYDLRSIQVLRNGVVLNSGDQFTPGETLTVQISTIASTTGLFKFMFEAAGGALFQTGNILCNGKREYNLGDGTLGQTSLLMPTTANTQVNIWVAWATQFGHVYTSNNFTLINFPSTQQPSLSPNYKSIAPTAKPTKVPTVKSTSTKTSPQLHFSNGTQQSFTLVLERQVLLNAFGRSMITINGSVPGPTLRVQVGQWVNIRVINKIGSEMSVIHWHGFDQKSTQWNDGPAGVTQCPINTFNGTKLLSSMNSITQLNYRFFADRTGTYWYHGHYNSQYPEGLYGAIVVEDDSKTTLAYKNLGATYSQETEIMIADFYQTNTNTLLDKYLMPSSNGLEPVPDYIVVNNMFTKTMQISVNRNQKIRLRVINAAALSMYDISVDGCPLTVIEVDGSPLQPKQFSTIRLDAGQRASFILDWSLCSATFAAASNIPIKIKSVKEMYRQYDQTDTVNWGLFGSATNTKYVLTWVGQFVFPNSIAPVEYYYYGSSIPTPSTAPVPVEPNLLEMTPLFNKLAPPLDLVMDYNITFTTDPTDGVHKFFVNGATPQNTNPASPVLYDYMMPQGGALKEFNLPKYAKISGDGKTPFVIPYNRSVTITVRNSDGAGHPLHLHGHNFWIMATSQYTPLTPIMRDVVSVPAQGWTKIRFISDNPGVWLSHCHIDWHMSNGFLATMIEAPSKLQNTISNVPSDHKAACQQYFAPTSTPTNTPSIAPMSGTWKPTFLPTKTPTVLPTLTPSAKPVNPFSSADPFAADWKMYGYDKTRRGYNPTETKISSLSVNKLTRVWRYQLAGGAYMQPVIVLNYDFGNFPNTKYARRNLQVAVPSLKPVSLKPSAKPTFTPSVKPSSVPSIKPSFKPSVIPTVKPSLRPSLTPTIKPSRGPSMKPSMKPTSTPSVKPTLVPSMNPTSTPTMNINSQTFSYVGCYGDLGFPRAFSVILSPSVSSVTACFQLAVQNNLLAFGIQNGVECWGSASLTSPTQYGQCGPTCTGQIALCTCSVNCASGESCGGAWANSVYSVVPKLGQQSSITIGTGTSAATATSSLIPTIAPSTNTATSSFVPTTAPSANTLLPPTLSGSVFSYLGCYGDNAARSMTYSFGIVSSIASCYNLASSQKWQYFAMQYGGECWVSNSLATSTQYGKCGPGCTGGIQLCTCSSMLCASGEACGGPYANSLYMINIFTTISVTTSLNAPSASPLVATGVPISVAPSVPLTPISFSPSSPTYLPTLFPSVLPTALPTLSPGMISQSPTKIPTRAPTSAPIMTVTRANFTKSTILSAVFVGDEKGGFHAVNLVTGQAIWKINLGFYFNALCGDLTGQNWGITASPVFNRTVNTVYVVGGNGSFNALSMKTGAVLWKINNFYDKTALHSYGGLNLYNGIVYTTLGAMCDQLLYKGGVIAVNTFTRSIQSYFSASSNNPNVYTPAQYGGGVWGLGGITIGDPSVSGGSPNIYFNTGNCLGNNGLQENALYCESILKTDINLNLLGQIKPPKSTIIGDNDYGSSATYFNARSDTQTSGCKIPMIASIRKDFLFSIVNADTMAVTQTFQIGARDRAQGIQQAVWDSYENLLIMTNQFQGTNQYAGQFPSGVLAFQLNATCGLNLKWNWVGNPSASVMLVGPPGQRVAIAQGGYGGTMLDVKTGVALRTYNLGGSAASPPSFANGYMLWGLNDPTNGFAGQVLEAWQCVGC